MPIRAALLTLALALFSLPAHAEKMMVVASFSILGDMVRVVGGDFVNVVTLVGPDSDAHVYEPTPDNAVLLSTANLVVVNGLGFEGWLDKLIQSSGYKGRIAVASEGIKPLMINDKAADPHAWQDVNNARIYVKNIADALATVDANNASSYYINADHYLRQLDALDIWVQLQIAKVPENKRNAITSHDAFGYFAQSYGVVFMAPMGVSTSGDASAKDIANLIDQIRTSHVHAVFMENMSDPRLVKQLVRDAGAVIGGTLYSDALSAPDGPAGSYIAMIRHNVTTMVAAMKAN